MNIHATNEYKYSCCKWIFMLQMYIHCKWLYTANEYSAAWLMELIVSVVWGDKSPLSEEDQTSQRTSFAWRTTTFLSLMLKNLPESDCPTIYWSWWETKFVLWLTPLTKLVCLKKQHDKILNNSARFYANLKDYF